MLGNTELNQDFKEFLQSLNANRVRYLIVGGYAVAIHGHPRYTKDLDIWVDLEEENAAKVVQALIDFGFGSLNLQISDFLEPDTVIQLGYPPSRIDLLIGLDGAAFEECYAKRLEGIVDGIRVCVVDRDGLIRLKEAAGRPQDVADVDKLSS
jgi:predicted nucleotidyltransferase